MESSVLAAHRRSIDQASHAGLRDAFDACRPKLGHEREATPALSWAAGRWAPSGDVVWAQSEITTRKQRGASVSWVLMGGVALWGEVSGGARFPGVLAR